jgi:hypothetical protein
MQQVAWAFAEGQNRTMDVAEQPWNDWYHCMGNTYGTWLPGDPRGFRTRDHREHVEGDYKRPPKENYDQRHHKSKDLMKREPVYLAPRQRARAVEEFVRSLHKRKIELICLSIDRVHFHLLARFRDHNPRKWVGIAKKESSHYLKQEGLAPIGGLWATRFECIPIADRKHQLWTVPYILKHKEKGGVVWLCKGAG